MKKEMVDWLAKKLSSVYTDEARVRFLLDLKHNPDHVVWVFSKQIPFVIMQYAHEKCEGRIHIIKDPCDTNIFETCAKHTTTHLKSLLQEELADVHTL